MVKDITQSEVNVGLIGHVDHGKTSITKMLSGKWTDTHSEELKRGISIRLGYADVIIRKCKKCKNTYTTDEKCSICGGTTEILRKISLIDSPGHETLMATMLSGATLMQGVLLVVAANEECPQPQTVEHLMAIKLSGIKNIIVVQNKIDLVDKEKALNNYKQIKEFLKLQGFKDVPIIPISANQGVNKEMLVSAIEEYLPTPEQNKDKKLKMFSVRSFDINSPGTMVDKLIGGVLGGSIISGVIKDGEEIEISPGFDGKSIRTKVISLNTEAGKLKEAKSGGLIAVGTELDPSCTQNDKMKGQVISHVGDLPEPTLNVLVEFNKVDRIVGSNVEFKEEIKMNEPLVLTIGTSTNIGFVKSITKNKLALTLKVASVIEKDERIAISRKSSNGWRLYGYGIYK
jgi:translation initiation factor 2 subunit 3